MYDFYMERMWARQEEQEWEERMLYEQHEHEAHEQREYERWLEEQHFASLEVDEYECYRAAD